MRSRLRIRPLAGPIEFDLPRFPFFRQLLTKFAFLVETLEARERSIEMPCDLPPENSTNSEYRRIVSRFPA